MSEVPLYPKLILAGIVVTERCGGCKCRVVQRVLEAGLSCGSFLRKSEVFAYVGRNQPLKDVKVASTSLDSSGSASNHIKPGNNYFSAHSWKTTKIAARLAKKLPNRINFATWGAPAGFV